MRLTLNGTDPTPISATSFTRSILLPLPLLALAGGVIAAPIEALAASAEGCTNGSLCLIKPTVVKADVDGKVSCCVSPKSSQREQKNKSSRGCSDCRFCSVATVAFIQPVAAGEMYDSPAREFIAGVPQWHAVDTSHRLLRPPRV